MKRIDQWKLKLKAAKSEIKHKERQMNAAIRSFEHTYDEILKLESKINDFMAKTKQ
jgi:hypothetical protein